MIAVPDGPKQPPTTIPAVTSVTLRLPSPVNVVPAGNVTVIWLFAVADNPPVADVVNPTVYVARAPGELSVKVTVVPVTRLPESKV